MLTDVTLPLGRDGADPNRVSLDDALERVGEADPLTVIEKLRLLAGQGDDISHAMEAGELDKIGARCCAAYDRDKRGRKDWEDTAREALDAASQDGKIEAKNTPWPNASNINVPLLTTAALQFNARMLPAVVKGDEAILCKVVGQDNGRPVLEANPVSGALQPVPQLDEQGEPVLDEAGLMVPHWRVPPGAKAKRARRVSEYLNTVLFYRMEDWEEDTDSLLMQLPIVGCVFRKVWPDPETGAQSAMVSALNIIVPQTARSLKTTPRLTEEIEGVYPWQIRERIASGQYREVDLELPDDGSEDDGPRLLLEQHCRIDIDGDGLEEPYIVTLDHATQQVLRIEANFGVEDITVKGEKVVAIKAGAYYVKYGMFPHPKGHFYDIGLGHLLKRLGAVIDTSLNQLLDAGTAQTAGGGFIGAGVRLQTRGQRGVIRMAPGEYKTVDVTGDSLRANIVERTKPDVSPVTFQVLDFIMGFAKEIAGAKDVLTGEASNSAPVGSTLALIEQGLQVFNATAKRFFRAAKREYGLIFDAVRRSDPEAAAADYLNVLDDPEADFAADFSAQDMDIRPVSDPSTVTRMQKMAKAAYVQSTMPLLGAVGGDPREALRRSYEAADVEDIDKLLPPPKPQAPDPMQAKMMEISMAREIAKTAKDQAGADKATAEAAETMLDAQEKKLELELKAVAAGEAHGAAAA